MTTANNATTESQSPESFIVAAKALEPTIRALLAGINAVLDQPRESPVTLAAERGHPNDRTGNRMRAYVASVRQLRGVDYNDDIDEANQRGRSLIERLALSADGTDLPELRLSAEQVADVLSFVASVEPVEPEGWWNDPKDAPSHLVGFYMLLQALEESLREPADTARTGGNVDSAGLRALIERMYSAVTRARVACGGFGDFSDMTDEDARAALVVSEAAQELEEIHNKLDGWCVTHLEGPVARAALKAGEAQEDDGNAAVRKLTEKCARAKALMEEAQALVDEVLEHPEYRSDVLPNGVVPSGVNGYLRDAIEMLEEEAREAD